MGSLQTTVHYCCVSRGNRILYAYNGGDHEIEDLAALCLEKTPAFHRFYFQTTGKKTFGFLVEDGNVYFTIMDEGLGNRGCLRFLEHVRDEFKKVTKKGSTRSMSGLNSICLQEQLVPVIRSLITSLERISHDDGDGSWSAETPPLNHPHAGFSSCPIDRANGQVEVVASTKAPLLGKSIRQEKKKKMKDHDHVIAMRDVELEEHRASTDRGGVRVDMETLDCSNQSGSVSSISLQKDSGSMRIRSGSQSIFRKKWWRLVRIVLAIDAAICLILFVIWLVICYSIGCIR